MSVAAINAQFGNLNGLCGSGYGAYGGYNNFAFGGGICSNSVYSDANVENMKSNMENAHEISAFSSVLSNKSTIEDSSYDQQCQAIQFLLQEDRADDALKKYNELFNELKASPYYEGLSDNEIKTKLQKQYMQATGTTLVNDVKTNTASSFTSGLQSSIPVAGLLLNNNSKEDIVAKATNTPVSGWSYVKKGAGLAAGVAGSAAAFGTISKLNKARKLVNSGTATGIVDAFKRCKGKGKFAAILAAGLSIATFAGAQLKNNESQ